MPESASSLETIVRLFSRAMLAPMIENRDRGEVGRGLENLELFGPEVSGFGVIDGKGAKEVPFGPCQDGHRHARREMESLRDFLVSPPQRIGGNVVYDDAPAPIRRGATGAVRGTNRVPVEKFAVLERQGRGGGVPQMHAVFRHEGDRANEGGRRLLDECAQALEDAWQRFAPRDERQYGALLTSKTVWADSEWLMAPVMAVREFSHPHTRT